MSTVDERMIGPGMTDVEGMRRVNLEKYFARLPLLRSRTPASGCPVIATTASFRSNNISTDSLTTPDSGSASTCGKDPTEKDILDGRSSPTSRVSQDMPASEEPNAETSNLAESSMNSATFLSSTTTPGKQDRALFLSKKQRLKRKATFPEIWTCHECRALAFNRQVCGECAHGRCTDCLNASPASVHDEDFDPEGSCSWETLTCPTDIELDPATLSSTKRRAEGDRESVRMSRTATQGRSLRAKLSEEELAARIEALTSGPQVCQSPCLSHQPQCLQCQQNRVPKVMAIDPNESECVTNSPRNDDSLPQQSTVLPPLVPRVYRAARIRIRHICDRCHTVFTTSRRCAQCGHERCGACVRSPPRQLSDDHHDLTTLLGRISFWEDH